VIYICESDGPLILEGAFYVYITNKGKRDEWRKNIGRGAVMQVWIEWGPESVKCQTAMNRRWGILESWEFALGMGSKLALRNVKKNKVSIKKLVIVFSNFLFIFLTS